MPRKSEGAPSAAETATAAVEGPRCVVHRDGMVVTMSGSEAQYGAIVWNANTTNAVATLDVHQFSTALTVSPAVLAPGIAAWSDAFLGVTYPKQKLVAVYEVVADYSARMSAAFYTPTGACDQLVLLSEHAVVRSGGQVAWAPLAPSASSDDATAEAAWVSGLSDVAAIAPSTPDHFIVVLTSGVVQNIAMSNVVTGKKLKPVATIALDVAVPIGAAVSTTLAADGTSLLVAVATESNGIAVADLAADEVKFVPRKAGGAAMAVLPDGSVAMVDKSTLRIAAPAAKAKRASTRMSSAATAAQTVELPDGFGTVESLVANSDGSTLYVATSTGAVAAVSLPLSAMSQAIQGTPRPLSTDFQSSSYPTPTTVTAGSCLVYTLGGPTAFHIKRGAGEADRLHAVLFSDTLRRPLRKQLLSSVAWNPSQLRSAARLAGPDSVVEVFRDIVQNALNPSAAVSGTSRGHLAAVASGTAEVLASTAQHFRNETQFDKGDIAALATQLHALASVSADWARIAGRLNMIRGPEAEDIAPCDGNVALSVDRLLAEVSAVGAVSVPTDGLVAGRGLSAMSAYEAGSFAALQ